MGVRSLFVLAVLLAAAMAVPRMASTQDARAALSRFAGRFDNPLADDGASKIANAIETGISEMHAMRRFIAQRRLRENNPPIPAIELSVTGSGLMVDLSGGRRHATHAFDTWVSSLAPDGGRVEVLHRFANGQLIQAFRERNGGAEHVFALSPDGSELELTATITSPHIPRAISYSMTLQRAN